MSCTNPVHPLGMPSTHACPGVHVGPGVVLPPSSPESVPPEELLDDELLDELLLEYPDDEDWTVESMSLASSPLPDDDADPEELDVYGVMPTAPVSPPVAHETSALAPATPTKAKP
jgi:hypothetical protein